MDKELKKELKKDLEGAIREFLFDPICTQTKLDIGKALRGVLHKYNISEDIANVIVESYGSQITVVLHLEDRCYECKIPGEFIEFQPEARV